MLGATQISRCIDEQGEPYSAAAGGAARSRFDIDHDIVVNLNSSLAVTFYRKNSSWLSGKSFCATLSSLISNHIICLKGSRAFSWLAGLRLQWGKER